MHIKQILTSTLTKISSDTASTIIKNFKNLDWRFTRKLKIKLIIFISISIKNIFQN